MQSSYITSDLKPTSNAKKSYGCITVVSNQQQVTISMDIWKKALKETSERLCPVRAAAHECGCLPMFVSNRTLTLIKREDDTRSWGSFLVYFSYNVMPT
jgi:hypothetical protein